MKNELFRKYEGVQAEGLCEPISLVRADLVSGLYGCEPQCEAVPQRVSGVDVSYLFARTGTA